jgi:hypothetical protein
MGLRKLFNNENFPIYGSNNNKGLYTNTVEPLLTATDLGPNCIAIQNSALDITSIL